ncbi:MAG: membrane protein insertion efficiency factor YidD [Planctomycetes bacterium]|nr:membrane protein insertion efficiency factor YidD [Planctomycetota bacterium]
MKNQKKSLKTESAKKYNSFSPPKFLALGLLKFYQTVLTQGIKTSCPFCITCSSYSVKALKQYGIILGYIMTIDRLLRCNRSAGNKYFIFAAQPTSRNSSRRRICFIDEPANNNIFNRKVRKK